MLLIGLFATAVLAFAGAVARADNSQTPIVTGCPAGYES